MSWNIMILYKGDLLKDPAHLKTAEGAVVAHFAAAGCNPFQAAQAAFIQEGEQEDAVINGDWAEAWRTASCAVAAATGLAEADVAVELHRQQKAVRA